MSTATKLLTAEEFARLPDTGQLCELVRGEIVEVNIPKPRHGQICALISHFGLQYNDQHDRIHVLSNDAGVITEHDPDTVRGPDVWFVTYNRLPKGPLEYETYIDVVPEIVFEVVSPSDRWSELNRKITEYLAAGVSVVCVLEPDTESLQLCLPDNTRRTLSADEELRFPEILPEFAVPVRKFFE